MDMKPIPPDGKVADLRNAPKPKTEEEVQKEKQERHDKLRRNLRILALCVAAYYFISAGYSWYEESQSSANATAEVHAQNPIRDAKVFREKFNELLNKADTSLPTANANDTPEGFVAVLSTAIEIRGTFAPNSKTVNKLQIQTRYPEALPPESLKAFETFVLTCEQLANPNATVAEADQILNNLGVVPEFDANPDGKVFNPATYTNKSYSYNLSFTSGPIDELTLTVEPLVVLAPEPATTEADTNAANDAAAASAKASDEGAAAEAAHENSEARDADTGSVNAAPSDVPRLN